MTIYWSLTYELSQFAYVLISNLNEFNISLKSTTNSGAFYLLVVLILIIQS